MKALRGSQRLNCVAYCSQTTTIFLATSEESDVTYMPNVVLDRAHETAHGVCPSESELGAAVENGRGFHVDFFVDAEQGNVAGHFDPLASDVFMAFALEAALVTEGRNFWLEGARALVLPTRRAIAAASGLADLF
jgi:hypothetical protein